jgi:hypothetical protein
MGNLITGAIVLLIYFLFREYYIKKSFIKLAMIIADRLDSDDFIKDYSEIVPKKDTSFYLLNSNCESFESLNSNKSDLLITDLKYTDLFRFKQLIDNCSNNNLSDKEFFTHNSQRHLIFPFKSKSGEIKVILLEKVKVSLDDLLNRNPRK